MGTDPDTTQHDAIEASRIDAGAPPSCEVRAGSDLEEDAVRAAMVVLRALRDASANSAFEIQRCLREKREPDGKLVRTVETALLVAIMSPKVRDEDDLLTNGRSLLETASGIFRAPLPTRQNVRNAYKGFEAAFHRRIVRS